MGSPVFFIIVGVGFLAIIIAVIVNYTKRQGEKLEDLAGRLGMEVVKGGWASQPTLHGIYKDRPLSIQNIYHNTGKSGYYTYKIACRSRESSPARVDINISRYGTFGRFFINLGGAFGYKTIAFDDYEFNSSAVVRSKDEDFARSLLDAELKQDIQDIRKGKVVISDNEITYEARGRAEDNESHVHGVLPFLSKIEVKLSRSSRPAIDEYSESQLSAF